MTITTETVEVPLEARFAEPIKPDHPRRRALGRGLESLLPSRPSAPVDLEASAAPPEGAGHESGAPLEIPVEKIDRNPFQTRTQFDQEKLAELAASISATGVVQPILVRALPDGRYQLIAGERRLMASKLAQKATIPAILRHVSDEQAMEITIVENLQRADLNPMEQARAYQRLLVDFRMTQDQIAVRTGKNRASISNFLRLLKLPPEVQANVEAGQLSLGHAKALLSLQPELISIAAKHMVETGMSVRYAETEIGNFLNQHRLPKPVAVVKEKVADPNVREAQDKLQQALGLKVRIVDRSGRGKVIIHYGGLEDFDAILEAVAGD